MIEKGINQYSFERYTLLFVPSTEIAGVNQPFHLPLYLDNDLASLLQMYCASCGLCYCTDRAVRCDSAKQKSPCHRQTKARPDTSSVKRGRLAIFETLTVSAI